MRITFTGGNPATQGFDLRDTANNAIFAQTNISSGQIVALDFSNNLDIAELSQDGVTDESFALKITNIEFGM